MLSNIGIPEFQNHKIWMFAEEPKNVKKENMKKAEKILTGLKNCGKVKWFVRVKKAECPLSP